MTRTTGSQRRRRHPGKEGQLSEESESLGVSETEAAAALVSEEGGRRIRIRGCNRTRNHTRRRIRAMDDEVEECGGPSETTTGARHGPMGDEYRERLPSAGGGIRPPDVVPSNRNFASTSTAGDSMHTDFVVPSGRQSDSTPVSPRRRHHNRRFGGRRRRPNASFALALALAMAALLCSSLSRDGDLMLPFLRRLTSGGSSLMRTGGAPEVTMMPPSSFHVAALSYNSARHRRSFVSRSSVGCGGVTKCLVFGQQRRGIIPPTLFDESYSSSVRIGSGGPCEEGNRGHVLLFSSAAAALPDDFTGGDSRGAGRDVEEEQLGGPRGRHLQRRLRIHPTAPWTAAARSLVLANTTDFSSDARGRRGGTAAAAARPGEGVRDEESRLRREVPAAAGRGVSRGERGRVRQRRQGGPGGGRNHHPSFSRMREDFRASCRRGELGRANRLLRRLLDAERHPAAPAADGPGRVDAAAAAASMPLVSNRDFHYLLNACTSGRSSRRDSGSSYGLAAVPSTEVERVALAHDVLVLQMNVQEERKARRSQRRRMDRDWLQSAMEEDGRANAYGMSMVLRGYGRLRDESMVLLYHRWIMGRGGLDGDDAAVAAREGDAASWGSGTGGGEDASATTAAAARPGDHVGDTVRERRPGDGGGRKNVVPDVVLCNTLIDALVRCDLFGEARLLFEAMLLWGGGDGGAGVEDASAAPVNRAFAMSFLEGLSVETAAALSVMSDGDDDARTTTSPPSGEVPESTSTSSGTSGRGDPPSAAGTRTMPGPNQRTYNTYLKGLIASSGAPGRHGHGGSSSCGWEDIETYGAHLSHISMWDAVTTNTMVNACVLHGKFDAAEDLLRTRTVSASSSSLSPSRRGRRHPNVEAYTELLDGYAKSNRFDDARHVFEGLMTRRNVRPNAFTYTAYLYALAREGRLDRIEGVLRRLVEEEGGFGMDTLGGMYNAIFTGLLLDPHLTMDPPRGERALAGSRGGRQQRHMGDWADYSARIRHALSMFSDMIRAHDDATTPQGSGRGDSAGRTNQTTVPRPNVASTTILLRGLARCCHDSGASQPHRQQLVRVGQSMYDRLVRLDQIPRGHAKVHTALIQLHAAVGDVAAVKRTFAEIRHGDTVALNAYLDACARCDSLGDVLGGFRRHVGFGGVGVVRGGEEQNANIDGASARELDRGNEEAIAGDDDNPQHIRPDVITYTILIHSLLKKSAVQVEQGNEYPATANVYKQAGNAASAAGMVESDVVIKRVKLLYDDMRTRWNIVPDKTLVDSILDTICSQPHHHDIGRISNAGRRPGQNNVQTNAAPQHLKLIVSLVKQVLSDAKRYGCYGDDPDEYESRVRVVRRWLSEGREVQSLELFRRHGWNTVDSSFRLFGGGEGDVSTRGQSQSRNGGGDDWLQSKGWNDVDSGFRVL